MRIAHLILAHDAPLQLKNLILKLSYSEADFYIHVDLKTDIKSFEIFLNNPHVFFVKKRVKVRWGAYSIVQATINGFVQILQSLNKYDYINLLSVHDYPIQRVQNIHNFLQNNMGKAFMETLTMESEWGQGATTRLTKYHLTGFNILGKHKIAALLNAILPKRKVPEKLIVVGRSQWFTISFKHMQHIVLYLQQNARVKRYFQLTWGADEFIFQTILYNSRYKDDMVNNNLRYIKFIDGESSPVTFTSKDLDLLMSSGKLFARKFNPKIDNTILNMINAIT